MKLEGSLDAFSLPDVFQLLSLTKKSGCLHLTRDPSRGVVFFTDGSVTGASADGSRQALARRLVGSGAVNDEALASAVEAAGPGAERGIVRSLLEAEAVDGELLRQAATEQTVDAVFDLLRWQDGSFAFALDRPNPDDVGISLETERIVTEANARKDSWEQITKVVPSGSVVLAMPVVLPAEPEVSRDEWALLALVDGRRTVAELVDLTGAGQYAVVSTLAALIGRGLLEIRKDERHDHVSVVQRRHRLLSPLEAASVAEKAPPAAVVTPPRNERRATSSARPAPLGGAHQPGAVVPPRPEPFLPSRRPDHPDASPASASATAEGLELVPDSGVRGSARSGRGPSATPALGGALDPSVGSVDGSAAVAPRPDAVIERDPSVNRSLLLRLIAGVRGL
jgi:uncharacterized protein DUF4388